MCFHSVAHGFRRFRTVETPQATRTQARLGVTDEEVA